MESDKTTNSDNQKVESLSDRFRNLQRLFSITNIEDMDSEKQKIDWISSWHEKAYRALSRLGIHKTTNSGKQDEDKVSFQTMIELIKAIRGKKLHPLTYIPEDTNNIIAADDKTTKETERKVASEQNISGDQEGANSVDKRNNFDMAKKKMVAAMANAQKITDETEARTAANVIFTAIARPGPKDAKEVGLKKLLEFVKDEKVKEQFRGLADDKPETVPETSQTKDKQTAEYEQINTEDNPGNSESKKTDTEDKQSNPESKKTDIKEKQIKKSVFRSWVVDIYRDHDSLNSTLQHSKTAIDELNVIASVIVLIVITIVWLLFMEFLTTKLLVFMSSQLLLVVFIFGNTVKNVFEAVIFVFLVHPFDVGDRCVVGGVQASP